MAAMNDRARGSSERSFCAVLAMRGTPYRRLRAFQSSIKPYSNTRCTRNGSFFVHHTVEKTLHKITYLQTANTPMILTKRQRKMSEKTSRLMFLPRRVLHSRYAAAHFCFFALYYFIYLRFRPCGSVSNNAACLIGRFGNVRKHVAERVA